MRRRALPIALLTLFLGLGAGGRSAYAEINKVTEGEIDQIELSGVTVLTKTDIESALELTAGDRFERAKVVRSVENLKELYQLRGYASAVVSSSYFTRDNEAGAPETVLKFTVEEGNPVRVTSIHLVAENIRDQSFNDYWKKIEEYLSEKVGIVPGDVFDQERVASGTHILQNTLASEEYIGANINDVRVKTSTAPPEAVQNPGKFPASRWIDLEFHVDLGDRVSFGFRGNKVFTQGGLVALIDELRTLGLSKDYVTAIQTRIEDEYRANGYAFVKVTAYTFEYPARQERHVTYTIDEGPRVAIESVNFEGNLVFSNTQLQEDFFADASRLIQRRYYVQKEVDKTAELVVQKLKAQGYLSAKLVTISNRYDSKHVSEILTIYIYEGDQTIVRNIRLGGLHLMSEEEAKKILTLKEGTPLNLYSFNEGMERLKEAYHSKGYLEVAITNESTETVVKYAEENRLADIDLDFNEGAQYRVSKIEIEGRTITHEDIISREFTFRKDEVLSEDQLTETETRLRKLGIFSGVTVRPLDDPEKPGYKIVRVSVQEGTPGIIAGGVGYRNDLGIRVFSQVAYTNLWKDNHTLSFTINTNRRFDDYHFGEFQAQMAYTWPWFAKVEELTFRPTVTVGRTQYILFDDETIAFAAIWEKPILHKPNLIGLFTYSLERIRQFNAASDIDNQTLRIGSIIPALRLDLRDDPLAPTRGLYAYGNFEYASTAFFSQKDPFPVGYWRSQFRSDYLIPVGAGMTWFLSFRTGFEKNTEFAGDPPNPHIAIPLIKQFTLGGAQSLRGFSEQELNYQDTAISGTMSYVNYRTQFDLPFAGPMRFGPFLDAGNLNVDRYDLGNLRYGVGVGFHYQTPVGPVNFDWGFKVDRKPTEDPYNFYFSIGVI